MKPSLRSRRRKEAGARVRSCLLCCGAFISGVASALAQPPSALRPPYGEIGPAFWEQYGWAVIVAGFVALIVIIALIILLTRPERKMAEPPEAAARCALAVLQNRPQNGALIMEVSRVFRRYVIFAYNLPAGEPTTAELNQELRSAPNAEPMLAAAIGDFFRQCDEDKFSPPALPPHTNVASRALQLLNRIEAHRRQTLMKQPVA
jgi:hypothetical protein